jgi:hypothetical protein
MHPKQVKSQNLTPESLHLHIAGDRFDIVDTKVLETIEVDSLTQFWRRSVFQPHLANFSKLQEK